MSSAYVRVPVWTDGKTLGAEHRRSLAEWCWFEKAAEGTEALIEAWMDSLNDEDAQVAIESPWCSCLRSAQAWRKRQPAYVEVRTETVLGFRHTMGNSIRVF